MFVYLAVYLCVCLFGLFVCFVCAGSVRSFVCLSVHGLRVCCLVCVVLLLLLLVLSVCCGRFCFVRLFAVVCVLPVYVSLYLSLSASLYVY